MSLLVILSRTAGARPRALILVATLLLVAGGLVTLPAGHAAAHESVTARIVTLAPTVVGPDGTQEVTVRVTNGGDTDLTDLQADLGVGWRPVGTRSQVAAWAENGSGTSAARQVTESLDQVPAGASADFQLSLEVSSLRLDDGAGWGPRPLSVQISAGGTVLDVVHSFLLYDPDAGSAQAGSTSPDPVHLALVAPVTGPAPDPVDRSGYDQQVVARTGADAALGRLATSATEGTAGLSLAVDPAVLAAADTSPARDATAWVDRVRQADVVTLPPYDVDVAALAHAEVGAGAITDATDSTALLPDAPRLGDRSVVWPQGTTDLDTLAAVPATGAGHALVTDLPGRTGAETSALDVVDTEAGQVSVVAADENVSDLVAATTAVDGPGVGADDVQRLLADVAVLADAAEDAGTTSSVVGAMPRGWSPDVTAFEQVVTALDSAGWVELAGFTELLADAPAADSPTTVEQTVTDPGELAPSSVRELVRAGQDVGAYASVAADPHELTAPVDRDLVAPLALAYRGEPAARDAAQQLALAQAAQLRSSITVGERGDVTLVSDSGALPVRIRNELPVDATVTVELTPSDPRVVVETAPTVVVPAGASRDAQVRVRAIGSGDIDLDVEALAPDGTPVADPTTFAVRVRAGWETVGTAVLAGAVGLLFLGGIWRTVRRGRSDRRTTGAQVAESTVPAAESGAHPHHDPSEDETR